jgi:hypothetical protein
MSTIRVDNFGPSAGGTTYSARGVSKAWVNFNGTGTIAARDSENVSSLTDNGTGDYTANFTNAMGNANYSVVGLGSDYTLNLPPTTPLTSSSTRFNVFFASGTGGQKTLFDVGFINGATFGDLA